MAKKYHPGFSLVELMVVISLVAILSIAISSMVLTTVAQITRVRTQIKVRQSGDYAMGQIQTMIRNSRSVIFCDPDDNYIEVLNPDGNLTLFSAVDLGDYNAIASNSGQFLTPPDVTVADTFQIECLTSNNELNLVKVSFTLTKTNPSDRPRENASIHYETSIELRNN